MLKEPYAVTVTAKGGAWIAVVQGVPEATVRAHRLSALDPRVRQLLAEALDRPASSFVLEYSMRESANQDASP